MREEHDLVSGADYSIEFIYDGGDTPMGFIYNDDSYYYRSNIQGDVIAVYDIYGVKTAGYTYDAWGNQISQTGALAEINPFRYRGYYYDSDSGMYYLNARYYDPKLCRFISSDSIIGANGDFIGYNLYAYCSDNPVMHRDISGYFCEDIMADPYGMWDIIGKRSHGYGPPPSDSGYGWQMAGIALGSLAFVGAAVLAGGALSGRDAALDFDAPSAGERAAPRAIPKTEDKEREKEAVNKYSSDTVIYRWPDKNTGIVIYYPRERDDDCYSMSFIYKPGSAKTTLGALRSTGLFEEPEIFGNHIAVVPKKGTGTLGEWKALRELSKHTIALRFIMRVA